MTQTSYVCPVCGNTIQRDFDAPSVVRTCENGCGFSHFVREPLLEKLQAIPEDSKPEDWDDLTAEERVMVALTKGELTIDDLR